MSAQDAETLKRIERANQQAEELIRGLDERIDRLEQLYTRLLQTNDTKPEPVSWVI